MSLLTYLRFKRITVEIIGGTDVSDAIAEMISQASVLHCEVGGQFNDIIVIAHEGDDFDDLYKAYLAMETRRHANESEMKRLKEFMYVAKISEREDAG